jgi:cytochrome c
MPAKPIHKSSPAVARVQPDRNRRQRPGRSWLGLVASLALTANLLSPPRCRSQELLPHGTDSAAAQVFNNACRTCHTIRKDDNRLGPSLYAITGRRAGSLPDYGYSSAMKDAGFVWDDDTLARFIARPDEVVPGNNMKPYSGLASADSARIAAFLAARTSRR